MSRFRGYASYVRRPHRLSRGSRQAPAPDADCRTGQSGLEIAAVTDRACKSTGGGPALLFEKPAGFDMPVATNVFGSMERMCLALGVSTLDDLAREINELMTPPMPEGIMDALKMLPMVGRLRDLMPKTVKDAPCQEIVQRDGTLDDPADPEVLARRRRAVHHAAPGVHQGSRDRRPQHRHVPHAGVRRPHDRHALAASQGRGAASPRGGTPRQAA